MTYTLQLEDEEVGERVNPEEIDYGLLAKALSYASLEVRFELVRVDDISKLDLEALSGNLYFSITDPIGQLAEWIAEKMRELAEWFSRTVDRLLEPLRRTISDILSAVSTLPSRIRDIISSAADTVIRTVRDVGSTVVSQLALYASEIMSRTGDTIRSVASYLSNLISTVHSALSSVARSLADMISSSVSALSRAIDSAKQFISTLIDRVIGAISNAVSTLVDWVRKIIDMIRFLADVLPDAIGKISDAVSKGFDTISKTLKDLLDKITSSIRDLSDKLSESFSGVVSEIGSRVRELIEVISSLVSGIRDFIQLRITEVLVPLEAARKILDSIIEMLPRGFKEILGVVKIVLDAIDRVTGLLMDFIISAVNTLLRPVHEKLDTIVSELGEKISPFITSASNTLSDLLSRVKEMPGFISQKISELSSALGTLADLLREAVRGIVDAVSRGLDALSHALGEYVGRIISTINSVADSVSRGFSTIVSEISSRVGDLIQKITAIASEIKDFIQLRITEVLVPLEASRKILDAIIEMLPTGFKQLVEAYKLILDALGRASELLMDFITALVNTLLRPVHEKLDKLLGDIGDKVAPFISPISETVRTILTEVSRMPGFVAEKLSGVASLLADRIAALADVLGEAIRKLADMLSAGFSFISSALRDSVDKILSTISSVSDAVSKGFSTVVSEIASKVGGLIQAIADSVSEIKGFIQLRITEVLVPLEASLKILDVIIEMLPRGFRDIMEVAKILFDLIHTTAKTLMDFIYSVVTAPLQPIHEKLDTIIREIGERISPFISPISDTVGSILSKVGEIPGLLAEKASEITSILVDKIITLAEVMRELTAYVRQFGGIVLGSIASIEGFVRSIAEFLSRIPEIVANTFGKIPEFIEWVVSGVRSLGANVVVLVREKVLVPLAEALKVLKEKLSDILEMGIDLGKMVFEKVADIMLSLWNLVVSTFSKLIDLSFTAGRALFSMSSEVGMRSMGYIVELFTKAIEMLPKSLETGLSPVVNRVFETAGISSPPDISRTSLFLALVNTWAILLYTAISALLTVGLIKFPAFIAKGYAIGLAQYDVTWEIDLTPMGVGVVLPFKPFRFVAGILSNFADELTKFADKIYEPFWFGMAFWLSRYFSLLFAYEMRNTIPIRLPTLRELEDLWRRARVSEVRPGKLGRKVKDALEGYIYYTKLRGYSDFLIEASFADPERLYFTLKDRFGIERVVPLARAWRLPTPSVVARMWVRDVLRPTGAKAEEMVLNLTKIYEATGLHRDIGLLYTLLAFRYPSPRALSEFYWRSMASLNWLTDSMEEVEWSRMFNIRWKAVDPYSLNLRRDRAEILNRMMSQYLKWHDLFPSAWDENFPTDKAVIMELTADLPTRIDLRWLTRWGIFEHMSRGGVNVMADLITMFSQVQALTGQETRETKVTPEISLDVRFLSRFLIGRRINPVVAPIVAVAQIHAVLTPSFTLLRTGFIEALRRGWITLDTAESLMSGLFVIRFRTGYIDPETGEFKEFIYRKPVFWLPAERRLLQIRGILDRYNWLMRDTLMRVVRALTLVSLYPEEGREILFAMHSALSEHIKESIGALSGIEWKPEMDVRYINIWMLYAEALSIIGARTWVRRHVSRTMGWVFFRILTGIVRHEHLERILGVLKEIDVDGKKIKLLSDVEIAYYSKLGRELIDLVRRESIPSPSTLGTFAEYMVVQQGIVERVLEEHNIPEEFRDLWRLYIRVKPVKSDFRSLITVAIRAFRVKVLDREALEKMLEEAKLFGFTDIEIELIRRRVELEEAIEDARGWKPSLSNLITISELVPEALEYFNQLKIDPRFRDLARRYATVKPLADEARALVNTYFRARRYMEIPREIESSVREVARLIGVTDTEWKLREMNLELQLMVDEARVWTPTPGTLATLSEFISLDSALVEGALERRKVVDPWRSIWLQYIRVRPVKSDYRSLINIARRARALGVIPEHRWNEIIKGAQEHGFTSREIEIIRQIADLDIAIANAREWTPSVMSIISISELVPEATEMLKDMPVRARFRDLIVEYARRRQVADEIRRLLSTFQRMKRLSTLLGQRIPSEIESAVEEYSKMIGLTEEEKRIRALVSEMEVTMDQWLRGEVIPTLGMLSSMAEFIDVPGDYVTEILNRRRVEKRFAEMWLKFIQARVISTEVGRVVSAFTGLATRFSAPKTLEEQVKALMRRGGWTEPEIEIFDLELAIRRHQRMLSILIPTLRQAIGDSLYMREPGRIIEDTLAAYGITVMEFSKQVEYYKRLAKNRRIWRHFSWYRTQLVEAYSRGVIDELTLRARLQKFKDLGLVDDDEIELIVDGAKLRALARARR